MSRTVELRVEGMTCASCAARVEAALGRVEGVEQAKVNLLAERATVRFDEEKVTPELLREAVERVGYSVGPDRDLDGETDEAEEEVHGGSGARHRSPLVRLCVAAAFSTPALVMAMVPSLQFSGWELASAVLTAPVVWWAGWEFHSNAIRRLLHRTVNMDTLVSVGTATAWSWSAMVLVSGTEGHVYFETGAVIVTVVLLGRLLEDRAKRRAGDALRSLARLTVKSVTLEDGTVVPAERLEVGDRFRVRPGERIAVDGVVVDGAAAVDASVMTGEPVPVAVAVGDEVLGGTLAVEGTLLVEATRVGTATTLSRIRRLVTEAQASTAPIQRLADRVSAVFVPTVIAIALVTFGGWMVAGHRVDEALTAATAVLVIACPCALGLATPTAITVGVGRGAAAGILIRGGEVLEAARDVTTVVFDKTGTLTEGRMRFAAIHTVTGEDPETVLTLAGAVESVSEHPIARAVEEEARSVIDPLPRVEDFRSFPGRGAAGVVDGREVVVGARTLFESIPPELDLAARQEAAEGRTPLFVGWEGTAKATLSVEDRIRPSAAAAVMALHAMGLRVMMLSGDNHRTAQAVAGQIGIDEVVAEVLPEGKVEVIRHLREEGAKVAMVGDGVNDAPALASANLGIAMASGTDIADAASDITLLSEDLLAVPDAIRLSRATYRTIVSNLFWAFFYNVAAIPLAASGRLDPMIAAATMSLSSVFVVGNSLRLRRWKSLRTSQTTPSSEATRTSTAAPTKSTEEVTTGVP
ncbi:MAG: carbonate dehydratase [Acidimicrobiales bacterium]|nr:MAG: carbonate dehydratase [Acidimicrobiales bacterium]